MRSKMRGVFRNIIGVTTIVLVVVTFNWWKKSKEQKNKEAEQTERILKSDLGDLKDDSLKDLENKYK